MVPHCLFPWMMEVVFMFSDNLMPCVPLGTKTALALPPATGLLRRKKNWQRAKDRSLPFSFGTKGKRSIECHV